ncbi:MAG: glycoside hydrolase family 66 protein [Dermatophilaceae bacterium]
MQIVPTRSWYAVGEPVVVEPVLCSGPAAKGRLIITRLGELVGEVRTELAAAPVDLGPLPAGTYAVSWRPDVDSPAPGVTTARTAVQVLSADDRGSVLRYGFVADYRPGRDVSGMALFARRLHLTAIQCYDWAYRHADLVGGGEQYADALGNPVDLDTVRAIVAAAHGIGADALGYAAVYGVGNDEWPRWEAAALLDATGTAYGLGDFLRVTDPADPHWLAHFTSDLAAAVEVVGFDGFHLDQYGWPKAALRPDGTHVDLAERFCALIEGVRAALPRAPLVFNNVNDFPTWATARTSQDAVYIEVWEPHIALGDLGALASRTRALGPAKPVVIAAYPALFASAAVSGAEQALRLTMATLFSHGATHLAAGEDGRLLVDPYYVRNHAAEASTIDLLADWQSFLVAHHDLLLAPGIIDVTGAYAGAYNDDVDVAFAGAAVSGSALAGHVWRRVTQTAYGLVVHLINLSAVTDLRWDVPQEPPGDAGSGTLRVRRVGAGLDVRVADPDGSGVLETMPIEPATGTHAEIPLPPLRTWQVIHIVTR